LFEYCEKFIVIRGGQFFKNGDLDFGPCDYEVPDTFYRTGFTPCFAHSFVTIAVSDEAMRYGIRRLTGIRCPETPGRHWLLCARQEKFIFDNEITLALIAKRYAPYFEKWEGVVEEMLHHVEDVHDKRKMRMAARDELNLTGQVHNHESGWTGRTAKRLEPFVTIKGKSQELMKPDKAIRTVVDIGLSGSLLTFRLAEYLKIAQSKEELELFGGLVIFVKAPRPDVLQRCFDLLYMPPGRFTFIYFSDDSCLSFWEDGVVKYFNLDISSCDASHTGALFEAFKRMFPACASTAAQEAIDQCQAPLRIRSRSQKGKSVVIRPLEPRGYSGSGLTTAFNNFACLLIIMAIAGPGNIQSATLAERAENAGYILTGTTPLKRFQEIQFLKHSPVWSLDHWCPVLNLGVLFRASGFCKYDLPGRGAIEPRARTFQHLLLKGMYPYVSFPFIDSFKKSNPPGDMAFELYEKSVDAAVNKKVVRDVSYPMHQLTDEEVFLRYDPTVEDFADLQVAGTATFGDAVNFRIVDKILKLDYGAGTTDVNLTGAYNGEFTAKKPNRA